MKPEDRKRLKQHIEMIVGHKIPSNVVFCPNCEKDTECIHTAELYECKDCGEDFAKYIVSRKPANSDVSVTQNVLTDIKTGQSIENTNPDYYKQEIARLTAELAELNDKAVFIQFKNEDELPADISDDVYSAMFECSHVDGVRLFPYIEENGQKYFLVMIEEENKSRLVYIVTMYRYGDREKHSYVLGAFSTENDARECGEKEKDYRGGKYEPEIIKFYVDSQRIDDFVGDSDHEHDDRIL